MGWNFIYIYLLFFLIGENEKGSNINDSEIQNHIDPQIRDKSGNCDINIIIHFTIP